MKVSRNVAGRPTCLAIATIATMCACAPLPQAQAASLEWVHTETNGPFAPRISAAAAVIDRGQAALLMGGSGHYPNGPYADVWRFHPNGTVRRPRPHAACGGNRGPLSLPRGSRRTLRVCMCVGAACRLRLLLRLSSGPELGESDR